MPFLEIIHLTGEVEQRALRKRQPVSIGSHSSNDIQVDEEGVEIMHCRISWSQSGYEAVAAGTGGIDVNGTTVHSSALKPGDVLRFGSIDIRFCESKSDGTQEDDIEDSGTELGLKPLSEEIPVRPGSSASQSIQEEKRSPVARESDDFDEFDELDEIDELEELDEIDELDEVDDIEELDDEEFDDDEYDDDEYEDEEEDDEEEDDRRGKGKSQPATASSADSTDEEEEITDGYSDKVRAAMRHSRVRPGEEDTLRSPLVLGLAGTAVALVLMGAIFYFIANRQTVQDRFDVAQGAYDEGKFSIAITEYNNFISLYPKDDLSKEAKKLKSLAEVRMRSEGAAPKFPEALEKLRSFINEQRDAEDFETSHPLIMEQAKTISTGAASNAGRLFDPELLAVSRESRTVLKTYSPKDAPPTEILQNIENSLRISEAQILRHGVYNQTIAGMEAALTDKNPMEALKVRRSLFVRYPDDDKFPRDKKLNELFQSALSAAAGAVKSDPAGRDALVEENPAPTNLLTLAFQGRTRTDEISVGKSVVAVAKDCVYGVDFITGEPVWRRVIGYDSPFFPLVETKLPSVVVFDTVQFEVVRLHQTTGQLIWRQPIGEMAAGYPIFSDDRILIATESGRLLAIDLETGHLVTDLKFPQSISGPMELADGQRIVVAGNEEVVYTLKKRPLEVERVSYIGQQPGSIDAPLLSMGSYLLMVENQAKKATLHLMETPADGPLNVVATGTVEGNVVDTPVIRGRDLFVPSTGERVSAFSISDDPGQPPLTTGPSFQGEGEYHGPMYLMTGPDRQIWMATGALARLQLTTDSMQPDGEPVARGIASQPIQYFSGYMLNARQRPFSSAVTFTRTNRDDLVSDWQTVLGSRPLAATVRTAGGLSMAFVNESGQTWRVGDRQLAEGPFLTTAAARLPLHQDLVDPLEAAEVVGNRLAVVCSDPEPRMWIINAAGQIEGSPLLPTTPSAAPTSIGKLVVAPLKGRLHVPRLSGQAAVQDFALPTGDEQEWVNVVNAGENGAVAVTDSGTAILIRYQTTPRPHLGEATRVELNQSVHVKAASGDGFVAVADVSKRVTVFGAERLDISGQRTFANAISNQPWITGGNVFVEEGAAQLHCLTPTGELASKWSFALNGNSVAGVLNVNGTLVLAQQNGVISALNAETGEAGKQIDLQGPIALGPFVAGEQVYVVTADGTLASLQPLLGGGQ